MKELLEKTVVAFILLAIMFLVGSLFVKGLEKEDKIKCVNLQRQADENKENKFFYITSNQKEMCDYFGISIDAKIGNAYE